MEKIVASIQVRMGSSRLPGKVMHEIDGKPLLEILLERLKKSTTLDDIVVATPQSTENDIIENYCVSNNINVFRGSENDVLGRTLKALQMTNASIGVEIFGDCPLIDFRIVDLMVNNFLNDKSDPDFVGNDLVTTFPPGMDVEVFKVSALEDSDKKTDDPEYREHGTLYIRKHPEFYKIKNIEAPEKWARPDLEMEVDTIEDMDVVKQIINNFDDLDFSLDEMIDFMDKNPKIKEYNSSVPRRWKKYRKDEI